MNFLGLNLVWETILTKKIMEKQGLDAYNEIVDEQSNLLTYHLIKHYHDLGISKDLYTGEFNPQRMPLMKELGPQASVKRLVNAKGLTERRIGLMDQFGNLEGPWNETTQHHDKPYITNIWGLMLRVNKDYFTYGPTDNLKALIIYHGEDMLEHLDLTLSEAERAVRNKDPYIFQSNLKGVFKGNAGTFKVDSNSRNLEFNVSIKQPLYLVKESEAIFDYVLFPKNTHYKSGSEASLLHIGSRPEYEKNVEPKKHELACLLALKYGHPDFRIEYPEGNSEDNLQNIIENNVRKDILTLYEPLEQPYINEDLKNPIFKEFNKMIFNLYYKQDFTMKEVDYYVLQNFWDMIITPELYIKMIEEQASQNQRLIKTCFQSGAVNNGLLMPGSVTMPMPLAKILINDEEGCLSFKPSRAYKLHRCVTRSCPEYNQYHRIDHNEQHNHSN